MTEKRGRGRPPVGRPVNVRFPDATLARIDAQAAELGVTRAEYIRTAVLAATVTRQEDVPATGDRCGDVADMEVST